MTAAHPAAHGSGARRLRPRAREGGDADVPQPQSRGPSVRDVQRISKRCISGCGKAGLERCALDAAAGLLAGCGTRERPAARVALGAPRWPRTAMARPERRTAHRHQSARSLNSRKTAGVRCASPKTKSLAASACGRRCAELNHTSPLHIFTSTCLTPSHVPRRKAGPSLPHQTPQPSRRQGRNRASLRGAMLRRWPAAQQRLADCEPHRRSGFY